jgi:anaerobic selenocysteine-containing dehydrogenase
MDWNRKGQWDFSLPALRRRSFIKLGVGAYASMLAGCNSVSDSMRSNSRTMLLKGERDWAASVCSLCASGCAIRAYFEGGRVVAVGGDPDDFNTGGKMCPIGLSMLNFHSNPDRVTSALKRNPDGKMAPAKAEEILALVAGRIRQGATLHIFGRITPFTYEFSKILNARCGPDPDMYGTSPYKPFLNTEGRPPILDFERARIALLFDTNILEHGYPFVGYVRRIADARSRGLRLITLSPFLTNTATAGDWIPLRSGAAVPAAALAIAKLLLNDATVRSHLPAEIAKLLGPLDPDLLAALSGLTRACIQDLARAFLSEPGPAVSDVSDPAVLLLNIMKGNLNQPGGLLHPGKPFLRPDACSVDIASILRDRSNVVLLHQSNPAFSSSSEIRPILRSSDRAMFVCIDTFMSETGELSDYVLPLTSPLETATILEPLPLAAPYLAAALPVIKPPKFCRSFDDWLTQLAAAVGGFVPKITPESFISEKIQSASPVQLVADRAIYPLPRPHHRDLEVHMPSIASSLRVQIANFSTIQSLRPGQYFMTSFEECLQGPGTAPSKWLDEITYSPKMYLHPARAIRLGIRSGDPVTLTGSKGQSITGIAFLYEGVHPDALAVPLHHGHTGYGRIARGAPFVDSKDPDMVRIFWGNNRGINPADLGDGIVTIRKGQGL